MNTCHVSGRKHKHAFPDSAFFNLGRWAFGECLLDGGRLYYSYRPCHCQICLNTWSRFYFAHITEWWVAIPRHVPELGRRHETLQTELSDSLEVVSPIVPPALPLVCAMCLCVGGTLPITDFPDRKQTGRQTVGGVAGLGVTPDLGQAVPQPRLGCPCLEPPCAQAHACPPWPNCSIGGGGEEHGFLLNLRPRPQPL